jgi:hypothetical protein
MATKKKANAKKVEIEERRKLVKALIKKYEEDRENNCLADAKEWMENYAAPVLTCSRAKFHKGLKRTMPPVPSPANPTAAKAGTPDNRKGVKRERVSDLPGPSSQRETSQREPSQRESSTRLADLESMVKAMAKCLANQHESFAKMHTRLAKSWGSMAPDAEDDEEEDEDEEATQQHKRRRR